MLGGHLQVFRLLDSSYFGSCRHSGSNNYLRISHVDWTLLSFFYTIVWCCCCWLGTVSLSINLCILQPKTPRERLCFLGLSLQCLVGVFVSLFPGGSYNRPPLFAPSFTRCIWCIRRDSIPPVTGDARLPENTQPPSLPCSNDFWALRSLGCLAPPWRSLSYLSVWFRGH